MRIARLLLTLVVGMATPLAAQARPNALWLDLSVGAGGDAGRAAVSAWRGLLRAPLNVRVSVGLRATAYVAMSTPYTNRGAVQGNLAPTLSIDPGVIGVNVAVGGELPLGPAVFGANLDLLGIAAGARWTEGGLEGKADATSVFRYGAADRGALNSEFYGAVALSSRMAVRVGASHYVTNYVVTDEASASRATARYQRFETVLFGALRFGW